MENELFVLEENNNALSEASFDAIFFSEKGICIRQNKAAELMFGYTNEEALGRAGTEWIFPDDREEVLNHMLAGFEKPYKVRALRKDGSVFPCEIRGKMLKIGDKIVRITSLRDLSEVKKIRNTLQETEQKYMQLINDIPIGIFITDKSGNFRLVNPSWSKMTGINMDSSINDGWMDCIYQDDYEKVSKIWNEELNRTTDLSFEFRVKDTFPIVWIYCQVRKIVDRKNNLVGYLGINTDISTMKLAVVELEDRNRFIDKIIDSSALSTWISDEKGVAIRTNQACLDFFGAQEHEVIGKYSLFKDSVIAEQGFMPQIHDVYEKGIVANLIIDYDFAAVSHVEVDNATHKVINTIITPVKDVNGKVTNAIIQTIDLTEVRRAQERIIEEKNRAEQYLNIVGVILLGIDKEGIVQLINPKGCEILGYRAEEIIGKNWFETCLAPEHVEDIKEVANHVYSGRLELAFYHENEILTKDGNRRLIAWYNSAYTDESGNIIGTLSSGTDITESKHEEQIKQVVYNIANAVNTTLDLNELFYKIKEYLGAVIDTSNIFIALYEQGSSELSVPFMVDEKDSFSHIPIEDSLTGLVIKSMKPLIIKDADFAKGGRFENRKRYGPVSKIWLGVPLKYQDTVMGALVIQNYNHEDVFSEDDLEILDYVSYQIGIAIERKKTEQELLTALKKAEESDQLKSAFLANVSHEIRTPLNSILGFTEILEDADLADTDKSRFFEIIHSSGNQLLSIIDDILNISVIEAGQLSVKIRDFNARQLLESLRLQYLNQNPKNLQFSLKVAPKMIIKSDESKIKQIIMNLVSNSIKNTDSGELELGCSEQDDHFLFHVRDTGRGIPAGLEEKIFNRFFRVPSTTHLMSGTGLGLAICKALVDSLGGQIWYNSEMQRGTTFFFTIPK